MQNMGYFDKIFSKKQTENFEGEGSPFTEPVVQKGKIAGIEVDYFTVEDEFGNETMVLKNVYSDEPGIMINIIGLPLEIF